MDDIQPRIVACIWDYVVKDDVIVDDDDDEDVDDDSKEDPEKLLDFEYFDLFLWPVSFL